jgi:hypothetical protein
MPKFTERAGRRGVPGMLLFAALVALAPAARAWVYPEHRELALLGVQQLDPERRAVFDRLWAQSRTGDERQLCGSGADTVQDLAPPCIDWAALSAIAGDHSCSSRDMFETARAAPWILGVADVAAQLKADLARIPVTAAPDASDASANLVANAQRRLASETARAQRVNALRTADIRLQRADPAYATRAGANNAHFLLARARTDLTIAEYAALTLSVGSEISAVGVYAYFHLGALQKASRLNDTALPATERNALARAALADEAFALHFLEDIYAAGHIAGTWGDASQRQGTHDFYNQNGLEVFTWGGGSRSAVLMGDAHMRPEDSARGSAAVRASLAQVLDVASGKAAFPDTPAAPAEPEAFDVCKAQTLERRPEGMRVASEHMPFLSATLGDSPVPSLGPGLGSMPRFRSELGPFVGMAASLDGRGINGGFSTLQSSGGGLVGLDLSVRAGFGLDGVLGEAGDGLVFVSIGYRADAPSSNGFDNRDQGLYGGNLSAAIPARSGPSVRLRMPFYLVPGDLLFMSPLFFVNPKAYANMAVTAGNGGLIPWQSAWATGIGRFQFVLGRELGVTFFGHDGKDQMLVPGAAAGDPVRVVRFKSTLYDLPILEYRPYRAFSSNQSSSVMFQLFTSADVPRKGSVDSPPGAPVPDLHTVWSIGLRLLFDWRYYY